jgi:hypothetical protein
MKTMALTDVILLSLKHLRAASVSDMERPQSSAFIISIPAQVSGWPREQIEIAKCIQYFTNAAD